MIIKQSSSLKPEETKGKFWKNRVAAFPLTLWVDLVVVTKHLWAPVRTLSWQPILASNWEPCSEMCLVLQAWPVWRVLQLLASRRSVVSLSSSPLPVSEGRLAGRTECYLICGFQLPAASYHFLTLSQNRGVTSSWAILLCTESVWLLLINFPCIKKKLKPVCSSL